VIARRWCRLQPSPRTFWLSDAAGAGMDG
jgi:hypothetical protein